MSIRCKDAAPLVPAYLDGELSEAQAGLLRKHLLDCLACRGAAQDLKGLKRWFVAAAADEAVPPGFAARVARRAFAGDTGASGGSVDEAALGTGAAGGPARELLPFVRELTALAAAVLLMLAIGLRMDGRPSGQPLKADEVPPLGEITETLDRLNEAEAGAAGTELREAQGRRPDGERTAGDERPR